MPDFDANEDPSTLPETGADEPAAPAEPGLPIVPRPREVAGGHHARRAAKRTGRLGPSVRSQRSRAGLRACNRGWCGRALSSRTRRRRLWTLCHGRPPGSPS